MVEREKREFLVEAVGGDLAEAKTDAAAEEWNVDWDSPLTARIIDGVEFVVYQGERDVVDES